MDIISLIKDKKIKRNELAQLLNVSTQYISFVLNRKKNFSFKQIIFLCNYFKLDEKQQDLIFLNYFLRNAPEKFKEKIIKKI